MQSAKLDKHNDKEGTKGLRLINMLDPMGKLFFSEIERRTKEDAYAFAYGYHELRRRKQALLVHNAVTWRLREAAREAAPPDKCVYSHVSTFRDIANAFPSLSHDVMRSTL